MLQLVLCSISYINAHVDALNLGALIFQAQTQCNDRQKSCSCCIITDHRAARGAGTHRDSSNVSPVPHPAYVEHSLSCDAESRLQWGLAA